MSILKVMGEDGFGGGSPITRDELAAHIRSEYLNKTEQADRRNRNRLLHRYYNAVGDAEIEQLIGSVFKDKEIIAKRQEWVRRAKYNNVIRRVINEKSTAYTEPARRSVADKADNERYGLLLRECGFDQVALTINRWLNLHNSVAVGFRVRQHLDGRREPVVDIVTPDRFWAISHPTDRTRLIALVFEMASSGPRVGAAKYMVVSDFERFRMTSSGHVMSETWEDNPFVRMPWVLARLSVTDLTEEWVNEDLRAAHEAVWFENVCLLKESKSATKVPVLTGDTSLAARGQMMDSEGAVVLPDGTAMAPYDSGMDLKMYLDVAENIADTACMNHGIAPQIRKHAGIQSADARDLLRVPLRELRLEQHVPLRAFESQFAEVMSMVCEKDLPERRFSTDGWSIDFGESQTPLGRKEENEVFEQERRLTLTSTAKEKARRNPDLTISTALVEMAEDVLLEEQRIRMLRPQMEASGEAQGTDRLSQEADSAAAAADTAAE